MKITSFEKQFERGMMDNLKELKDIHFDDVCNYLQAYLEVNPEMTDHTFFDVIIQGDENSAWIKIIRKQVPENEASV